MPRLPQNARLWKERAEIDYIGPFVKAWAAFNAWFRDEASSRRDRDGLDYVKRRANPVRSEILPHLSHANIGADGRAHPDTEAAQELKLLIADLHRFLEQFRIEVEREDGELERITFTSVAIKQRARLPQSTTSRGITFKVDKQNGTWISTVTNRAGNVTATINQTDYDESGLAADPQFVELSATAKAHLVGVYRSCCPRPLTNLLTGSEPAIRAGEVEFRCTSEDLYFGLIEVIYAMRNSLVHGELQPDERAFRTYEPAYRIIMRFLTCVQ